MLTKNWGHQKYKGLGILGLTCCNVSAFIFPQVLERSLKSALMSYEEIETGINHQPS